MIFQKKILSLEAVNKKFGPVAALSDMSLDFYSGTVHAVVGENGAGKSTLCKIICGIYQADSGKMSFDGHIYRPSTRKDASDKGIRIVMQELNLIDNLSVAENIMLDNLPGKYGIIDNKTLNMRARRIMTRVGLDNICPSEKVGDLPVGVKQMIEIAAGLSQECRILILDEPTASLTDLEAKQLFEQISRLKSQGVCIIYISHRMNEIKQVSDTIIILRDGRFVSSNPGRQLSTNEIVRKMVGRDFTMERQARERRMGSPVLEVEKLKSGERVKDVSFCLHEGEILGFAGLMGSGRTETMRAIFGVDKTVSGSVRLSKQGVDLTGASPSKSVKNRIAFVTEDRKGQGLFLTQSLRFNISFSNLSGISEKAVIDLQQEVDYARQYIEKVRVVCRSEEQPAVQLSGGNQQKVVIARWLFCDSQILIFDEPTKGIDVAAKFEIYRLLEDLADDGKSIIIISSDLKELIMLADRICVMSDGKLVETFDEKPFTEQQINAAAFSEYTGQIKGAV